MTTEFVNEFVSNFLSPTADNENRLMMLVTPLPHEQFECLAEDFSLHTKVLQHIDKLQLSTTAPTKPACDRLKVKFRSASKPATSLSGTQANKFMTQVSTTDYDRTHTRDGTLKRFTEDKEPIALEPYKLPPITMLGDNKAVTFTAKNPLTASPSRWLDVRWFRLREFVKEGYVRVMHIFTADNVADFFTKPLGKDDFVRFRRFLMNE